MRILTPLLGILFLAVSPVARAEYIDLGGPATGFLAVSNLKSSATQNEIEAKNPDGSFNPSHNGLPDYPNFEVPAGFNGAGLYTAIIASPQSTANDYSTFLNTFFPGTSPTINNQIVTQSDASTLSAGRIDYDAAPFLDINGNGVVPISALTFDLNTFEWDGSLNGDGGFTGLPTPGPNADNPASVAGGPFMISPFSPAPTIYNDSNGFGNAAIFYEIAVTPTAGSGLTFVNGELVSMDITGDLLVGLKLGQAPAFPAVLFGQGEDANPKGTFTASGLDYQFDLVDTESAVIFNGINMLFNRAGTASVVPAPTVGLGLAQLLASALLMRRRRRREGVCQ
ncbi:MAG: hypothetical protein AAGD07_09235 [Planctomycetota bacterium]